MIKNETINIPKDSQVFEDKRTKVKTIALPFVFPKGTNGILSITYLSPFDWTPSKDIESVTINFTNK